MNRPPAASASFPMALVPEQTKPCQVWIAETLRPEPAELSQPVSMMWPVVRNVERQMSCRFARAVALSQPEALDEVERRLQWARVSSQPTERVPVRRVSRTVSAVMTRSPLVARYRCDAPAAGQAW